MADSEHCYGCKAPFQEGEERLHGSSNDMLRWMVYWHPKCKEDSDAQHTKAIRKHKREQQLTKSCAHDGQRTDWCVVHNAEWSRNRCAAFSVGVPNG